MLPLSAGEHYIVDTKVEGVTDSQATCLCGPATSNDIILLVEGQSDSMDHGNKTTTLVNGLETEKVAHGMVLSPLIIGETTVQAPSVEHLMR